jgi:hypothetical protein
MKTMPAIRTHTRARTDGRLMVILDDGTVIVPGPRAAPQPAIAVMVTDAVAVPAAPRMRFLGGLLRRVARVAAPVVGRAVRTVAGRTGHAVDQDRRAAYAEAGRAVPTLIGAAVTGRRR